MNLIFSKYCKLLSLFLLLIFEPKAHAAGGSAFTTAFWQKKKESQWIKTLGGTGADTMRSVAVDSSGNVYVAGTYTNDGTNTNLVTDFKNTSLNGRGDINVFVAKLDKDGVQAWIKTLGGAGADEAYDVGVDASGNVYVTGIFENSSDNQNLVQDFSGTNLTGIGAAISKDVFVAKLNNSGTQLWIKKLGGSALEGSPSMSVDNSGNVFVSGSYNNSSANSNAVVDFKGVTLNGRTTAASPDAFIASLDTSGVQQWIKTLGGTNTDEANEVKVDASGNIFVAGTYTNDTTNSKTVKDFAGSNLSSRTATIGTYGFLAKLNSTGVQQWIKILGGTNTERITGIADAGGGKLYVGGFSQNDSSDSSSAQDFSGATLLGKTTTNSWDPFVAKLDANGTQEWITSMGGTGSDGLYGLVSDDNFNIYVSGIFVNNSIDANAFKDFSGTSQLAAGNQDVFVVKLDSSGTQVWFDSMGGNDFDQCYGLTVSNGTVYLPGSYSNNLANVYWVKDIWGNTLPGKTTTAGKDIFILKFVP